MQCTGISTTAEVCVLVERDGLMHKWFFRKQMAPVWLSSTADVCCWKIECTFALIAGSLEDAATSQELQRTHGQDSSSSQSGSRAARLLHMSRRAERNLMSYEQTGDLSIHVGCHDLKLWVMGKRDACVPTAIPLAIRSAVHLQEERKKDLLQSSTRSTWHPGFLRQPTYHSVWSIRNK